MRLTLEKKWWDHNLNVHYLFARKKIIIIEPPFLKIG